MLPALAGMAVKALLPSAKKINKDKLLNKKESSAIQKVDDESSIVKEPIIKKKTISTNLFLPPAEIKALPPAAEVKKDVKTGRLNDIFDRVGETLQGIIDTLKNRNQTQKEEESTKKQEAKVEEKKEREEKLEKDAKKRPFKKPNIKLPQDRFNIMRFFGNVLLGSLVLAIFNNLEQIIETLKNVFKTIKDFITKLGEFFSPLWNGFKWIVGEGTKLVGQLLGIPKENLSDKDILKNLNEIKDKIPFLKNLFEGINNTIESLRSGRGLSSTGTPGPSSYAPGTIPQSVSQDTEFTQGVTRLAQKYNVPEDYLYAVMGFETGGTFDPAQKNLAGSGATGLIQFMPSTAKGLGTTTEALSKMTRAEQLIYVDKYFSTQGIEGGSLSDIYMSVLLPAAVGKPEDFVLFGEGGAYGGQRAYNQNKGLDLNKDGKITKSEATSKVTAYLPQGFTPTRTQQQRQQQSDLLAQQASAQSATPTPSAAPSTQAATPTPAAMSSRPAAPSTQAATPTPAAMSSRPAAPSTQAATASSSTQAPTASSSLQPAAPAQAPTASSSLQAPTASSSLQPAAPSTQAPTASSSLQPAAPAQAPTASSSLQPAAPAQAQVSPTQAPPAVSASVPQIMQQAEYEVPGGTPSSTILPIPIGGGSGPMVVGGGGTRVVPIGMSKQALLNSYYQTQLIGFLYKQG